MHALEGGLKTVGAGGSGREQGYLSRWFCGQGIAFLLGVLAGAGAWAQSLPLTSGLQLTRETRLQSLPSQGGDYKSLVAGQVAASQAGQAAPSVSPQDPRIPQPGVSEPVTLPPSDVFGAHLFSGTFARPGPMQFNPDYLVSVGDALQVRLWGAFTIDGAYTVDPQGNIFLPHVGPVKVQGVRNDDLQRTVEGAVKKVFRANVFSYASLAAAQPVRVFVGGYVKRPGLFNGTSMDSLLNYLDQAGGIDPERGSFLNVEVKRGNTLRASVNLYDFLLLGRMPLVQLADGDVIFVNSRQNTVKVNGLVANAKRFEFVQAEYAVSDLIRLAKPEAQVTHVRIVRNSAPVRNTEYFPLDRVGQLVVRNGDELEFTSDKKPGTITVRVEGEHQSAQEYVLPYGARLGEIMKKIEFSERSDDASLQLFRQSVKERQKIMLNTALKSLESSVLTARSSTNEESRLRTEEAALILQWVERARQIEPSGQVMIAQASEKDSLLLENGDVIRVPVRDGLVLVSGEVLFPNAIAHDRALELKDYIRRAGGYSQSADTSRVIVSHRDGGFEEAETGGFWNAGNDLKVRPGDEILVLPKIQTKNIEVTRGLTQILYQLAISAKVILDL